MKGITTTDLLFYLLALLMMAGAFGAATLRDLRRASLFAALSMLALAGLFLWLGAGTTAVAEVAVAAALVVAIRRLGARPSEGAVGDTVTLQGDNVGATYDAAVARTAAKSAASNWRPALVVVALVVIAVRAIVIARWPLVGAGPRTAADVGAAQFLMPSVSLLHCLVTSLLLFGAGALAAITRESMASLVLAMEMMTGAAALALVSVSCFVAGGADGEMLASLVVLSTVAPMLALHAGRSHDHEEPGSDATMRRLTSGMQVVIVGVTLALLAGVW